ncbi:NCS2 family permease [Caviibacter abscessus]|uniref:NCS2 family permease n=1 Tax=Caviibacter abscessus TaxID=1766719 RepID=UPI0008342FEE|nr:NCS2 family permease [Caviibacter abscessus]
MLKRFGKFSLRTEIIAGITTFLTMAYILGVNPAILSATGMPKQSVFIATALSAGIASILMGIIANYPVALAPGMGVNAFFTYTVVLTYGYTWQEGLSLVFLSGIIFLIISLTGVRKKIIDSIPSSLKQAIGAGIGFFIAFIGLVNSGIIVKNEATLVGIGNLRNPSTLLAIVGLLITIYLMSRNIRAALFFSLIITSVIGLILGYMGYENMPYFSNVVSVNFKYETFGSFLQGFKGIIGKKDIFIVVFTFLFVDFFDTAGTLLAICGKIGLVDENENVENINKALLADSTGTIIGSVLGTSTVTSYIESTSGVAAGGRTGVTAITTGALFLLSTLFFPLLTLITPSVVAPALICVGILMATQLSNIDWHDFTAASSGFFTIIMMILGYSIADGIAAGFIVYVITMIAKGEVKNIKITVWFLTIIFILHFSLLG